MRCGPCAGNQVGLTGLMRNWGAMSKQCQRIPSIVFVRAVILFGVVGPAQHAKAAVDSVQDAKTIGAHASEALELTDDAREANASRLDVFEYLGCGDEKLGSVVKNSQWFQHQCAGTGGVRREALSWRSPIRPRAGNHLGEPATDGGLGIDVSVIVTGMQA